MNMWNIRVKSVSVNTPRDNHRSRKAAFGSRGRFCFLILLSLIMILLWPFTLLAEELTCSRLPKLMETFHAHHYAMKGTTSEIRMHAVDQMIKLLDPTKTLLYESDLKTLKPRLLDLFVSAEKGNCSSLQQVYNLLVARARENEAIVKKILRTDFRPDKRVKLNINIDKRRYVKTAAEKQGLLKKIVQFQIENALLAGIDLTSIKRRKRFTRASA